MALRLETVFWTYFSWDFLMIFVNLVIYLNADWLPPNGIPAQSFPPLKLREAAFAVPRLFNRIG